MLDYVQLLRAPNSDLYIIRTLSELTIELHCSFRFFDASIRLLSAYNLRSESRAVVTGHVSAYVADSMVMIAFWIGERLLQAFSGSPSNIHFSQAITLLE